MNIKKLLKIINILIIIIYLYHLFPNEVYSKTINEQQAVYRTGNILRV